jgi:hypothetical protein
MELASDECDADAVKRRVKALISAVSSVGIAAVASLYVAAWVYILAFLGG